MSTAVQYGMMNGCMMEFRGGPLDGWKEYWNKQDRGKFTTYHDGAGNVFEYFYIFQMSVVIPGLVERVIAQLVAS